jgi:hypothetical protein
MSMKGHKQAALALTLAATAAIAAAAPAGAAMTAATPGRSLVVTRLTMDTYSPGLLAHTPPLDSPRLSKGNLYVVTVQGTVSFYAAVDYLQIQQPFTVFCGTPQPAPLFGSAGGSGPVSNDAEFIFAQPVSNGACTSLKLARRYPNFQVNDGFGWGHPKLLSPKPVRRPTANHAYSFAIVGQGRRLGLELVDPDTRDDYGSFRITIRHAIGSDCTHGQWRAFALKRAAICAGDTANTHGVIPKLPKARPLTVPQGPIAHVVRDSDFPKGINAQLPAGALGAAAFSKYASVSTAAAKTQRAILTGRQLQSAAISRLGGNALPSITSTAMQFPNAKSAQAAYAALAALDARANAPTGATAAVAPATGVPGEVITYSGAAAGVEAIGYAGNGVYALRELQSDAGAPISANAVTALLASLISR